MFLEKLNYQVSVAHPGRELYPVIDAAHLILVTDFSFVVFRISCGPTESVNSSWPPQLDSSCLCPFCCLLQVGIELLVSLQEAERKILLLAKSKAKCLV